VAALNQNRLTDYCVIALATAGSTIPTFVIAPVIQLVFGLSWKLLPIGGWGDGALVNKIGPALTLALPQIAIVARLMRGSMIESLRSHHIRTARALGLSDWSVVGAHALRGAVLPIISFTGPRRRPCSPAPSSWRRSRHSRRRALFRGCRPQPRLHAGHGHGVVIALFTIVFN